MDAGLRRLASGPFWLNTDHAIRSLAELAILAILTRTLSQELFGQYQLLLSVFMVASITSLSGFNGSLMRALAQGRDGTLDEVMRLSWQWSLVGIAALIGVGSYWYSQGSHMLGASLLVTAALLPAFHVLRRWQVILHAKEQFKLRASYNLISSVSLIVVVLVVAMIWSENLVAIFLAYVATSSLWQAVFFRRSRVWLKSSKVESGWRKSGYKLLLSELFGVMYAHLDKLLLVVWLGAEGLAIYATAIVFGEGAKLVLGNVVLAYVPKLHRQDSALFLGWFKERIFWVLSGLGVMMGLLWLALPFLIELLFSSTYAQAAPFARWYLLIIPGHLAASVLGYTLIKEHFEGGMLASFVAAGVTNVLLYVVLIPRIGLVGAIAGSVGYYVVLSLAMASLLFWHHNRSVKANLA